ncbi:DNA repair protein RecO [Patescibacteria group bacterium]
MYTIYQTQGVILKSYNTGEASKSFAILTADLGLVYAKAQSVREVRSKLRYGLQDFCFSEFSLVRGRGGWRVTNVLPEYSLHDFFSKETSVSFCNILSLVRKLVKGEESNQELFRALEEAFIFLKENNLKKEELKNFECVVVMKVLHNLGYFEEQEVQKNILTKDLLEEVAISRNVWIERINKSIKATQL